MSPPSAGAHNECTAASQHGGELSSSLPKALLLLPRQEQAQICAAACPLQPGSAASTGKRPGQGAPGLHLCAYAGHAAAVPPSTHACQLAAPLSASGAAALAAQLPGGVCELRRRAEEPAPQRIRAVYRPSALPGSARGAAAAAGGAAAAPAEEGVDASAGSGASLGSSSDSSADVKPAGRTRALWGGAASDLRARHHLTACSGPQLAGAGPAMRWVWPGRLAQHKTRTREENLVCCVHTALLCMHAKRGKGRGLEAATCRLCCERAPQPWVHRWGVYCAAWPQNVQQLAQATP
jgi:hypothetical protein